MVGSEFNTKVRRPMGHKMNSMTSHLVTRKVSVSIAIFKDFVKTIKSLAYL